MCLDFKKISNRAFPPATLKASLSHTEVDVHLSWRACNEAELGRIGAFQLGTLNTEPETAVRLLQPMVLIRSLYGRVGRCRI
jgi:hypothetical protein